MPTPIHPLLWKLRDRPVHFLGSIHMGPAGGFEIPDTALQPFDAAEQVYFEISDADVQSSDFLLRQGGSLRDDLGKSLYARLEAHEDYDPGFENLKLEAVSIVMGARLYPKLGYTPEFGIEAMLCQRLSAQGRPRYGIETRGAQETAVLTTTADEAISGLKLTLDNPKLFQRFAMSLVQSIGVGDAKHLDAVRALMRKFGPIRAKALLNDREEKWATTVHALLAEKKSKIFVVGALHLAQSEGVIECLRKKGYEFDRVS